MIGRKNKIKQILTSLNQSIIVIIDDIDRLTPDEAYQIVRLVKAVADFPGTSFLLCFDPEYLAGALEKHGIKKSDQYVDKVVQLRVPLPLITYRDMQRLADIELANLSDKSLTDHFEKDQERLSQLLIRQLNSRPQISISNFRMSEIFHDPAGQFLKFSEVRYGFAF